MSEGIRRLSIVCGIIAFIAAFIWLGFFVDGSKISGAQFISGSVGIGLGVFTIIRLVGWTIAGFKKDRQ